MVRVDRLIAVQRNTAKEKTGKDLRVYFIPTTYYLAVNHDKRH